MLCHVVSCRVVSCRVVLCCVVLCRVVSCCTPEYDMHFKFSIPKQGSKLEIPVAHTHLSYLSHLGLIGLPAFACCSKQLSLDFAMSIDSGFLQENPQELSTINYCF